MPSIAFRTIPEKQIHQQKLSTIDASYQQWEKVMNSLRAIPVSNLMSYQQFVPLAAICIFKKTCLLLHSIYSKAEL
jgi:hypothetical protein